MLIGRYSSLSDNITFVFEETKECNAAANHSFDPLTTTNVRAAGKRRQIIIGNDVRISAGVIIMGGDYIGNGAAIEEGTVVSENVPAYAVAVGNSVRIIRCRFDEETIDLLQKIKWWNWSKVKIRENIHLLSEDVAMFIYKLFCVRQRCIRVGINEATVVA